MPKQTPQYSPQLHKRLLEYFRAGMFKEHAAHACRLTVVELDEWLRLGRAGREPYATLARDIDQAIADDAFRNQLVVSQAAIGQGKPSADVRAAQWNLERKHPHLYGRQATDTTPIGRPQPQAQPAAAGDGVYVPKWGAQA